MELIRRVGPVQECVTVLLVEPERLVRELQSEFIPLFPQTGRRKIAQQARHELLLRAVAEVHALLERRRGDCVSAVSFDVVRIRLLRASFGQLQVLLLGAVVVPNENVIRREDRVQRQVEPLGHGDVERRIPEAIADIAPQNERQERIQPPLQHVVRPRLLLAQQERVQLLDHRAGIVALAESPSQAGRESPQPFEVERSVFRLVEQQRRAGEVEVTLRGLDDVLEGLARELASSLRAAEVLAPRGLEGRGQELGMLGKPAEEILVRGDRGLFAALVEIVRIGLAHASATARRQTNACSDSAFFAGGAVWTMS